MSDLDFFRFDRSMAGNIIVGLHLPKLKNFVRRRRFFSLFFLGGTKLDFIADSIVKYFDDNPVAKKAFLATPYGSNPKLLAKRIIKDVG